MILVIVAKIKRRHLAIEIVLVGIVAVAAGVYLCSIYDSNTVLRYDGRVCKWMYLHVRNRM